MSGIAIVAWVVAVVLAVVVLTFCVYEVLWKARRLRADLARLQTVTDKLQALQSEVAAAQERLSGSTAG